MPALHNEHLHYSLNLGYSPAILQRLEQLLQVMHPALQKKKQKFPYNPEHGHSAGCVKRELRQKAMFRPRPMGGGY
jgi:hypothetical protein